VPASQGVAIGKAYHLQVKKPDIEKTTLEDDQIESDIERLHEAIQATIDELRETIQRTTSRGSSNEASIFDAHILILEDPDLIDKVERSIRDEKNNAEIAWWQVIQETSTQYSTLEDAYMRERAMDVIDVGRQVLRHLAPELAHVELPDEEGILLASELSPSDTAQLSPDYVKGVITAHGGATSHSAILARSGDCRRWNSHQPH
jgi:phosphotransferase system enzyme I (PtsI)